MTEQAPALLPIFRSKHQLDLLAYLFLHPDRRFSIANLEAETRIPQPTISREVDRLKKAGLLESENIGRMRLVHASRVSPYFPELYSLLLKTAGPAIFLRDRVRNLDGVKEAFIFGSWARRYDGEIGDAPGDIDLLLVGNPSPTVVDELSNRVERKLRIEVNPVILSTRDWKNGTSAFVRQIKKQPLVPLRVSNV